MAGQPQFVCEAMPDPSVAPQADIFSSTELAWPDVRPLKVYAFDPTLGKFVGNYMTASVRYEKLLPGPVGERFAVIDYDGTTKTYYTPVDLDDPKLLISGGLAPSETDPRFHQQMVYAVASETLQRFEAALGRRVRWRRLEADQESTKETRAAAAKCLNLFPHAMCQANAFYSPAAHGILFGYFKASRTSPGRNLPGQTVFTCLSHDIIAHETTHAIVDGIREYFMEPTNIDVPAFHEAFADLAALFEHFCHKEVLLDTLRKTGGRLFNRQLNPDVVSKDAGPAEIQAELAAPNPLVELAQQFGEASGMQSGLRSALGTPVDSNDINIKTEPHDRGSILVAAVFDAYFTVYTRRTFDLFRIFRAGGGSTDNGDLPVPLAERLAAEASRTAEQFFMICARALDYCPPVDITFGDFLRAVLTADLDFHPNDPDGVRDALMQAFRLRGIVADEVASFSEDSLFWPKVQLGKLEIEGLVFGDPNGLTTTEKDTDGDALRAFASANATLLGFDPSWGKIDAPSFHPMFHTGEDGRLFVNMVVELVQTVQRPFGDINPGTFPMRNGVTLLIAQDPPEGDVRPPPRVRFVIQKIWSEKREERVRNYYLSTGRAPDAAEHPSAKDGSRYQINFLCCTREFEMAAAKKAASAPRRPAAKKTKRSAPTPPGAGPRQKAAPGKTPASGASSAPPASSGRGATGMRVRMYRVGFGDFFLLTVRTGKGPKPDRHILIDCGVHAQDLGSIKAAVAQMAQDCGGELALVIMTHRHADHISGFGTCSDVFSQFTVDRVWMPWFENPKNDTAVKFQANLTALAAQLSTRLAARGDQFAAMADNITGGLAAAGGSGNQKALDVLNKGFKNTPAHDYYKAGDQPNLPQDLVDAGFAAAILGPPGDPKLITQLTNTNDQYLADAMQEDSERARTFPPAFQVASYPPHAFKFYSPDKVRALVGGVQPDVLAARAQAADNTLNNQSLVILFSFAGKHLLFAGDAQWGNWENFLYGGAFGTPGHSEMTPQAKDILGKIDFYKVGHHGSRNATPKDAVAAMRLGCVGMCSTQIHAYNEVPREPLLQALNGRMQGQLARSDQVAVAGAPANPDAGRVPTGTGFASPGTLFIDYNF